MEPVGYTDVGGRKGAFKMAIKKANGRWYMYLSHLWHYGWSIVDVTDPRDPKFIKHIPGANNTWNIQVTLHDNLMLVGGIADSGGCLITETATPTERYTSLAAFERCVAYAAADLIRDPR